MTRKIVQISTNHPIGELEELSVFALCDDGTLWYTICGTDHVNVGTQEQDDWSLFANVPQDPSENDDYFCFSKKGY